MIYISSACVKSTTIKESVSKLNEAGYSNIELSGGTNSYPNLKSDLIQLKKEFDLNYLCHNYFPPPQNNFVLNLASLDQEINELSLSHCFKAIDLSVEIGSEKFGVHAGFLFDIPLSQIGREINKHDLFDKETAINQFNSNLQKIINYASGRISIYIENNVVSNGNYKRFENKNPFLFTDSKSLALIDQSLNFDIILDVAHLKVSCESLKLSFEHELSQLVEKTDYIHISDNDGLNDKNLSLKNDSKLYNQLKQVDLKDKTITLEVYDGLENLKNTYELISKLN